MFIPFFLQRVMSSLCSGMTKPDHKASKDYIEMYNGYHNNLIAINNMCLDIAERSNCQEIAIKRIEKTIQGIINLFEPNKPDIKKMNTQHYLQIIIFLFEDLQEEFDLLSVHDTLYSCMESLFACYDEIGFNEKQRKATIKREEKVFKYLNEKGLFVR